MMYIHIRFHHLVDIEWLNAPRDRHPHGVADEIPYVMILQECWILRKNRTLVRLLDIAFQCDQALLARLVQQVVHHLERLDIPGFREFRPAKHSSDSGANLFQNVQGIRHQHGSGPGSPNDEQLRWLQQHAQIAVLHQVSAYHRAEDHQDPDDRKHRTYTPPLAFACATSASFCLSEESRRLKIESTVSPAVADVAATPTATESRSPHQ